MKLFIGLAFTAITAFALPSACPTATGTANAAFTGGASPSAKVPDATAGTDNVSTLVTAGGCTTTDLLFSNFAVSTTGSSGTPENPLPTAAGTYFAAAPTEYEALFSTRGPDGSADTTLNTKENGTETLVDTTSFAVSVNSGSPISTVTMTVSGIGIHASVGASGTYELEVCTGSTLVLAEACGTSQSSGAIALSTSTSLSTTIIISPGSNFVEVIDTATLICSGCTTNESGYLAFSDELNPEPSTFILMGTALAAVGLLRFRASRMRSSRIKDSTAPLTATSASGGV